MHRCIYTSKYNVYVHLGDIHVRVYVNSRGVNRAECGPGQAGLWSNCFNRPGSGRAGQNDFLIR